MNGGGLTPVIPHGATGAKMGGETGSSGRNRTRIERADACRRDATLDVIAHKREFFGGIWFKIFSERGPCGPRISL